VTGPEHYQEAENRLLMAWEDDRDPENVRHLVAEAQVHATLALAAATALNDNGTEADGGGMPLADFNQWRETVGANMQRSTS